MENESKPLNNEPSLNIVILAKENLNLFAPYISISLYLSLSLYVSLYLCIYLYVSLPVLPLYFSLHLYLSTSLDLWISFYFPITVNLYLKILLSVCSHYPLSHRHFLCSTPSFQDFCLTLSWRGPLSYRNQSIDLQSRSMDWFLYDNGFRHERVKLGICDFKNFPKWWIKTVDSTDFEMHEYSRSKYLELYHHI